MVHVTASAGPGRVRGAASQHDRTELAAVFATSKSTAHRIVREMTPQLAALAVHRPCDRRSSWVVDGTLIPTRDHRRAARSKNYRWSCNAQIFVRRCDLWIVATTAGGPGNRN